MTKNILLALALTVGSVALVTPTALACGGGYGQISPRASVYRAAHAWAAQYNPFGRLQRVEVERIEGDRAFVTFHLATARGDRELPVRMRLSEGQWRFDTYRAARS